MKEKFIIKKNDKGLEAIFHINNPDEPITDWCYQILQHETNKNVYYLIGQDYYTFELFLIKTFILKQFMDEYFILESRDKEVNGREYSISTLRHCNNPQRSISDVFTLIFPLQDGFFIGYNKEYMEFGKDIEESFLFHISEPEKIICEGEKEIENKLKEHNIKLNFDISELALFSDTLSLLLPLCI